MYTTEIFDDNDNKELGYDLKDDLMVFMNNDPVFYRKRYFPTMLKFDKYHKAGKRVQPRAFEGLVREAYAIYQNKFPVEGLEKELPNDICEEICVSIHEQETENCKNKFYEIDESVDAVADVAFCFGRFNPVHKGHATLWETVQRSGRKWFVGTNPNTHDAKNPLQFEEKATWMQVIHPDLKGHITPETSILTMASTIYETLKKDSATVAYVTDEKDWHWAGPLLEKYNGQYGPHGYYNFAEIKHIESPRITSSTILKEAVKENDEDVFYEAAGVSRGVRVNGKTFFEAVSEAKISWQPPKTQIYSQGLTSLNSALMAINDVLGDSIAELYNQIREMVSNKANQLSLFSVTNKWFNDHYLNTLSPSLYYIKKHYEGKNKENWVRDLYILLSAMPKTFTQVEVGIPGTMKTASVEPLPEILQGLAKTIASNEKDEKTIKLAELLWQRAINWAERRDATLAARGKKKSDQDKIKEPSPEEITRHQQLAAHLSDMAHSVIVKLKKELLARDSLEKYRISRQRAVAIITYFQNRINEAKKEKAHDVRANKLANVLSDIERELFDIKLK